MREMDVDWGFDFPVPHFTTVRSWLLRLGHYHLTRPKERGDDWVWIIDHSNQIGQEKCLVILGVRASQLPPPGEDFPLRLTQMEAIELEPVIASDKQVVYRQLKANVAKTGVPRRSSVTTVATWPVALRCSGRSIRRRSTFTTSRTRRPACSRPCWNGMSHWSAFAAQAGQAKCRIQQTEWSFLVPPSPRPKGRYMNLGELIGWGKKTLAILDAPGPEVLRHGTVERLQEKLGWLSQYREPLVRWSEMEQTIDVAVDFVRTQGLYRGAGKDLRKRLRTLRLGPVAGQLSRDLAAFVAAQARRLRGGERLPGSSEVLESCFGKFKTMERDHSKAGFTSLLLALAACVSERTQDVIHDALRTSKTRHIIDWIKHKLGDTFASKRRSAYQAHKAAATPQITSKNETKPEGSPMLAST